MEIYWSIVMPILTVISALIMIYFTKKIDNIATREDVGKITHEVEKVKQDFTVLTNKHNILFAQEKEALVSYLSEWNLWHSKLKIMFSEYDITNYSELKNVRKEWNAKYDDVQLEFSKVELFVNNDEIINLGIQLNTATYNLQRLHHIKYLVEIYNRCSILNHTQKEIKSGKVNGNDENVKRSIKKLNDEIISLRNEHNEGSKEFYRHVLIARKEFITVSKKYIRKDTNDNETL